MGLCVCLLPNISLLEWLFTPETIQLYLVYSENVSFNKSYCVIYLPQSQLIMILEPVVLQQQHPLELSAVYEDDKGSIGSHTFQG